MSTTAIIIANDPCPPHGTAHACLENILGDPILLWVLRALPDEVKSVFVITGDDHEKIAGLVASLKSAGEIKGHTECRQNTDTIDLLLELSKNAEPEPGARVLLLWSTQPLISPAALQSLASITGICALLPDYGRLYDGPYPPSPMSLPWSTLQSAAANLVQPSGDKTGGTEAKPTLPELRSRISKIDVVTQIIMKCNPEDLCEADTRAGLAKIQSAARRRIINHWLASGVAFMDTDSTIIGPRVELAGRGVLIEPQVRLEGRVSIGEGTTIGQGSILRNSTLGADVEIRPYCLINDSFIGDGVKVGPFANVREGSHLDSNVRLGNFVETKKARLHRGAKANHLSYLGDCEVGEGTNIGAGCITCNYDGFNKHRTIIGKNAFIGSDCQLVAPVAVGDGAILGAGATLTIDAPSDSLVLTRPETRVINKGAEKIRARLKQAAFKRD